MTAPDGVLARYALPEGELVVRRPRWSDGVAWSRARLAHRDWLEPWFPAAGPDWAAEQDRAAWVERWLRLRAAARDEGVLPLVVELDGALVGEVGIDAIDPLSGAGEVSVWMVRRHGSRSVFQVALLTAVEHAFDRGIDRLLAPTVARRRAGWAAAAGFRDEGVVARFVPPASFVDHRVWVLPNNPATRADVRARLAAVPLASRSRATPARAVRSVGDRLLMVPAMVRTVWPLLAAKARSRIRPGSQPAPPADADRPPDGTTAPPAPAGVEVRAVPLPDGSLGTAWIRDDPGTATCEAMLWLPVGTPADVARAALLELAATTAPGRRLSLRVPLDPALRLSAPAADALTGAGLTLVATFPGNPDGPRGWGGEERWDLLPG